MLKCLLKYFWKRAKRKTSAELMVVLDKEARERFNRLQLKLPKLREREMIGSALLCLEQKVDKIIKRQALKKIVYLKNENYDIQQIADYFNMKGMPAINQEEKWKHTDITKLLDLTEKGGPDIRNKKKKLSAGLNDC